MADLKNKRIFEEGICSDVTFIVGVEAERIEAHKCILSVSSTVFSSMFEEEKDKNEFRIPDITPSTFKALLKYLYTNENPEIDEENWATILYAADKYEIDDLKNECIEFVNENSTNNESLNDILSSDELNCDEIVVFRSAMKWASAQVVKESEEQQSGTNLRVILGPALFSIRFPLMSPNEITHEVIPKDILTNDEIVSILKKTSSQFKNESRIRICERFKTCQRSSLRSKRHSIKFKVDAQVKIHSFGIYNPSEEGDALEGRMLLKDDGVILGEESFKTNYENGFNINYISFSDPINIHPNKWYLAEMELDSAIVESWMGKNGQSKVTIEGVTWTFDPSNSEQTNVHQGQIEAISFSKIVKD